MKKIRIKYALILGLILGIAFAWGTVAWLNAGEARPVYSSSSLLKSIEDISELSLVQYNYTTVIGLKESKNLGNIDLPFTEKSFLATFDGQIKAGVTLEADILENAVKENKSIIIELPKAKITDHTIDETSLLVYDQSKNIINQIRIEDYNNAIILEKESMEKKALDNGILNQAEDRAAILLREILENIGYEQIEFRTAN